MALKSDAKLTMKIEEKLTCGLKGEKVTFLCETVTFENRCITEQ